jgi:hypothetical protein
MRRVLLAATAVLAMAAGAARATTITDPAGDFLGTYTGAHDADLDVTSFGVLFDPAASMFHLNATFAGTINPAVTPGFYVIGVNTGSAASPGSFAGIGAPGVLFNRVITIQKSGVTNLSGLTANISGNAFALDVPLGRLAPTGFTPYQYGFNLWPRGAGTGSAAISDFAPNNATITGVPEPMSWALMLVGFAAVGSLLRARRRPAGPAALRA